MVSAGLVAISMVLTVFCSKVSFGKAILLFRKVYSICVCVCVCVCECFNVCVFMCMYMCVHIYVYIHAQQVVEAKKYLLVM